MPSVETSRSGSILIATINRPEVRNAVDAATAAALADAFRGFDADATLEVAVLTGAAGTFCAGADLKAIAAGPRGCCFRSR
jgi:enoyl-CoA hydratase